VAAPLISVEELHAHPDVILLDVRYATGGPPGRPAFEAGHIPGAAYVDMDTDLCALPTDPPGIGGRHPLPSRQDFEAAMRRVGVSGDRLVVAYDDWAGRAAARAWWLLRFHGHPQVRVLDGGWHAWLASGGAAEAGPTDPRPGNFTARPGAMAVVELEDVAAVDLLVDARAPERYAGDHEPVDPVAGHIPGAVNVPTADNLAPDGTFRPVAELRATYAAVGAVPGADIAVYCGSGVTACHDLLALEAAHVPAALYAGSFSEWVSDRARPVDPPAR